MFRLLSHLNVVLLIFLLGCEADDTPQQTDAASQKESPSAFQRPVEPQETLAAMEVLPRPGSGQRIVGDMRAAIPVTGHEAVAWSPDGRTIAVAGIDRNVQIIDAKTGAIVQQFGVPRRRDLDSISALVFHPDGRRLIGGGDEGIFIWDITDGDIVQRLPYDFPIDQLAISRDGTKLAACSSFLLVSVFDLKSGRRRDVSDGINGRFESVSMSPDGRLLATEGREGTVLLLDVQTLKVQKTIEAHSDDVNVVAFAPDGKSLLSASAGDHMVRTWNTETGKKLTEWEHSDDFLTCARFSPGGAMAAICGREIMLSTPAAGIGYESVFDIGLWAMEDIAFSPDGRALAAVNNRDNLLRIFDLEVSRERRTLRLASEEERYSYRNYLSALPVGKRAKSFVFMQEGSLPERIEIAAGELKRARFTAETEVGVPIIGAVFPGGQRLVTSSGDREFTIWKIEDGRESKTISTEIEVNGAVAVSPDGGMLALAGTESYGGPVLIQLVDAESGNVRHRLAGHGDTSDSAAYRLAFSPDGTVLASGGDDATVILWDVETGRLLHRAMAHEGNVTSIAFSSDGKRLVSTGGRADETLAVWDVQTGKVQKFLEGHEGTVAGAAFSPDGSLLVSAGDDKALHVWDVAAGKRLHHLPGHSEPIVSLEAASDGQSLISLSRNGVVKTWDFADLDRTPVSVRKDLVRTALPSEDSRYVPYRPILAEYDKHDTFIETLALSRDETRLASGDFYGTIKIWDFEEMRGEVRPDRRPAKAETMTDEFPAPVRHTLREHRVAIRALDFSPDGRLLYSAEDEVDGRPGSICIWDVATGTLIKKLPGLKEFVSLAVSPDGKLLAVGTSATAENYIRLFDAKTGERVKTLKTPATVGDLTFAPNNMLVAACFSQVQLWDVDQATAVREWQFEEQIDEVDVSPDGKTLLLLQTTFLGDSQLLLYDLSSGRRILACDRIEFRSASDAHFTPDGRHVLMLRVSNGSWGEVMFYDAATGKLDRTLGDTHSNPLFTRNGKLMITSEAGGEKLEIWSLRDLFNDELQEALKPVVELNVEVRRNGAQFVLNLPVNGRKTQELLGRLGQIDQSLAVDLYDSRNLSDRALANLGNQPNVFGVRLPSRSRVTVEGIRHLARLPKIEELHLEDVDFDEALAALSSCATLRVLRMPFSYNVGELTDAGMAHLGKLKSLQVLELELGEKVTDAGLVQLANLTQLRQLRLEGGDISSAGLGRLNTLSKMQSLTLDIYQDLDDGLSILAAMPELVTLDLAYTPVTDAALVHLKDARRLRRLHLGNTKVTGSGFVHLQNLTTLSELDLGSLPNFHGAGLEHLQNCTELTVLDLRGTGINDSGLRSVAALSQLKILRLPDRITDEGLAHLAGLSRIVELDLSSAHVTGPGLKAVRAMKQLGVLLLRETEVGEEAVANLTGLTKLRHLDLAKTDVTDAALAHLKGLTRLEELRLSGTAVTDEGLKHLYGLKSLSTLHVDDTQVTDSGIEALKEALPDVSVYDY